MDRLVECVPNISEGRKPETIDALVHAIQAVPGVVVLDRQSDADHNRSVLTFVGPPESVAEAAFCAAEEALQRIDLTTHRGEHPRVGATDVIPFVPIRGVTLDDCVHLARLVGRRLAEELHIPVFLYEHAAKAPFRTRIEDIRRGGLDELAERMRMNPEWAPDFGDAKLHRTAGATIVGARRPLIAYNVNLASKNLDIAKAIAYTVRASNGGLPSVKAVGITLKTRGIVQVSMNLTNYEETPVHVAYEAVKANAAPGGGSVAAMTGASAMALGVMVAGRLLEKETQPQKVATLRAKRDLLTQLRDRLQAAIREDAAAYNAVLQSTKRPMIDPERGAAIQQSLNVAIAVPLAIMELAVTGRDVLRELIPFASTPLAADLKAGIFIARAAGECALTCVKVNLESLKDDPRGPELLKQLTPYEERLRQD